MQAVVVTNDGIEVRDVPAPKPGPRQVLIRVHASGLNRADIGMAAGEMHGRIGGVGSIPGIEFAGEIAELGSEVTGCKAGDRVMCSGNGGHAQFVVADRGRVVPMPASMSFEQAAALPVALQTMHDALITVGRLKAGDSVMIQGASSGIGLMGLLISKARGARRVIAATTSWHSRMSQYGADVAIDTANPAWADEVRTATDGRGVDIIVDQLSGGAANDNMRAAAIGGRIINAGRLGGMTGEFNFDLHSLKRIEYIGVTFRTRSIDDVREIVLRMCADLWPDLEAGRLALPIDRNFPLSEAPAAFAHMRLGQHFGKIVLTMP